MFVAAVVRGADRLLRRLRFLGRSTSFENSHSAKPLIYKITSVWGNHEGSMLLWVLILALFGALVALFGAQPAGDAAGQRARRAGLDRGRVLSVHPGHLESVRALAQAPFEGRDLNPILQDLGLAIHPPLLYLGYVGFSISFSFAVAALIDGRIDAAWARWVRPWTLAAWMFLTLGIAMGSYWAYYELGWGGWWFWDPVENASLMPWIAGTALLHSAVVMEKRNALKVWTILLAILTFSLSLLGTFLVRSGVLTSVHTFATDPARGVFILAILVFFIGGALALFAWRAPALKQGGLFAPISREGALVLQQSVPHHGLRHRVRRHALSARARGADRREDFGRRAVLQLDLRAAVRAAADRGAVRAAARLEARRSARRRAAPDRRVRARRSSALGGDLRDRSAAGRCWRRSAIGLAVFVMIGALTDLVERIGLFRVPLAIALRARARPAALGLGHGARAFRRRRAAARRRRREPVERRAHRRR